MNAQRSNVDGSDSKKRSRTAGFAVDTERTAVALTATNLAKVNSNSHV
jgi:hypothetical protein